MSRRWNCRRPIVRVVADAPQPDRSTAINLADIGHPDIFNDARIDGFAAAIDRHRTDHATLWPSDFHRLAFAPQDIVAGMGGLASWPVGRHIQRTTARFFDAVVDACDAWA